MNVPTAENDLEQSAEADPSDEEQPAEVVQSPTEHVCDYIPKGLISRKISEDREFMIIKKECSAVLQNKAIKKMGDPGKFVLSIQIRRTVFACSLVDLGSSINLMPYSVATRLGFTDFKSTRMSLVFADRSVKTPVGILEDLQIQVGNTTVSTDFVVLELDEESKDPLILGRPFLCTFRAIIDVRKEKIYLHLGDMVMKFEMNKFLKKLMLTQQTVTLTLIPAEAEKNVENIDTDGYEKMLDSARSMERMIAYLSMGESNDLNKATGKPIPAKSTVLSGQIEGTWSELKAPKVELKSLP
ncbi:hypothetical protein N665_0038s0043 [Sinapis alba]|nr:hypothetical protein N665_0038s0043 [Sinapis alba]